MQITPQSTFQIIRQLDNVNDTNTYYVQAVVRNANTDKILATVNLTSKGSQRFTAPYQVPADTSGLGTYISIVTSVYTDSGYSQLSQTYSTVEHTYVVIQPPLSTMGNGGTSVDYDKIKKFVDNIKFPGIPVYDEHFTKLQTYTDGRFNEIKKHVEDKIGSIPQPEKYDDKNTKEGISLLQVELRLAREELKRRTEEIELLQGKNIQALKQYIDESIKIYFGKLEKTLESNTESGNKFTDTHEKKMDEINENYKKLYSLFTTFVSSAPLEKSKPMDDEITRKVKKLLG